MINKLETISSEILADKYKSAIRAVAARFAETNKHSKALYEAALDVMPGGNTRSVLYYEPFPLTIVRADGGRLWDADGHEYVDFLAEYTTALYGHSHPAIRAAINNALDKGINLAGHNTLEVPLARLLCERFKSIDLIRFTNSGTEANLMAVAAAKIFSNRQKIIVFKGGYHGAVFTFGNGNSPVNVPHEFLIGKYNDIESVEKFFSEYPSEIAAVIIEPMQAAGGCIPATPDFLHSLREITSREGAVLIFDEVVTSRLSGSGRQGLLGICPDLTTFGKYVGGGMTFGAFGGKKEIMALFDPRSANAIPHAGTFNNNVLSMAAGYAGLSQLYTPAHALELNAKGDKLRIRLNEICERHSVPVQFTGEGSLLNIHAGTEQILCTDDYQPPESALKELFFLHLLEHGFYIAPRGYIVLTLVHTEDEIERLAAVIEGFMLKLKAM